MHTRNERKQTPCNEYYTIKTISVKYPQWNLSLARNKAKKRIGVGVPGGQRHVVSLHETCGQYLPLHNERVLR